MKRLAIGIACAVLLVLVVGMFLPNVQEEGPHTDVAHALAVSSEQIHEMGGSLSVVDEELVFDGEQKSDVRVDGVILSISSQGTIEVVLITPKLEEAISIKREPSIQEGKLVWSCVGRPEAWMPKNCI